MQRDSEEREDASYSMPMVHTPSLVSDSLIQRSSSSHWKMICAAVSIQLPPVMQE